MKRNEKRGQGSKEKNVDDGMKMKQIKKIKLKERVHWACQPNGMRDMLWVGYMVGRTRERIIDRQARLGENAK